MEAKHNQRHVAPRLLWAFRRRGYAYLENILPLSEEFQFPLVSWGQDAAKTLPRRSKTLPGGSKTAKAAPRAASLASKTPTLGCKTPEKLPRKHKKLPRMDFGRFFGTKKVSYLHQSLIKYQYKL